MPTASKKPTLALVTPAVTPSAGGYLPWEHGRYRVVDGVATYYIRKRLGGVRREFAVAHSHPDALAEWALFSRDPGGYRTPKERSADALTRTDAGAVRV